jgi:hypothetical protein
LPRVSSNSGADAGINKDYASIEDEATTDAGSLEAYTRNRASSSEKSLAENTAIQQGNLINLIGYDNPQDMATKMTKESLRNKAKTFVDNIDTSGLTSGVMDDKAFKKAMLKDMTKKMGV